MQDLKVAASNQLLLVVRFPMGACEMAKQRVWPKAMQIWRLRIKCLFVFLAVNAPGGFLLAEALGSGGAVEGYLGLSVSYRKVYPELLCPEAS